ncbi:MAG TPA: signal peptidase II [Solirubrobacteraceae bacterium]|jgi:signal peptidase II|nr:signal peptidase II [Solirubrobacteraceae bacterium]
MLSRLPPRPAAARRQAFGRAAAVLLWVLALDQVSKHTIGTSIQPGQVKTLVPGVLHLVYVRNTGVAFGVLGGGGALVYILEGVALVALIAYLSVRPERPWLWLPTGMLLGGAVGNLIDRVARGSVIDFIKLPHWPAFNLADVSITFGVIILVLVVEGGRPSGRES